jgi:hypothetical protein
MTTPLAKWTPEQYGVQHLEADLSGFGVRNVSVCTYQQDWTASAMAFPLAGEDPVWEETFPCVEDARRAAEQRYGLARTVPTVPVQRIEIYGARA